MLGAELYDCENVLRLVLLVRLVLLPGPGGCCSPRHSTHFELSHLESQGIL